MAMSVHRDPLCDDPDPGIFIPKAGTAEHRRIVMRILRDWELGLDLQSSINQDRTCWEYFRALVCLYRGQAERTRTRSGFGTPREPDLEICSRFFEWALFELGAGYYARKLATEMPRDANKSPSTTWYPNANIGLKAGGP